MTTEVYEFLEPLTKDPEGKLLLDFHQVPASLPEEPKIELPPINFNPLGFDDYAVKLFGLKLGEQELLVKWLDLIA
jgi:hypothetical protein